jgi:hypothetical protein
MPTCKAILTGRNPNSIAASVVAKWEGGLMSEKEAEANAKRLDREMDRSLHPDTAPSAA